MGKQILNGSQAKMILNGIVYGNEYAKPLMCLSLKYSSGADPIDYTYTVDEAGQYFAFGIYGDDTGGAFSTPGITTTGTVLYSDIIWDGYTTTHRILYVSLISCNASDTITLKFANYAANMFRGTSAGIVKIENETIKSMQIEWSEATIDASRTKNTDLDNGKIYLVLSINCGRQNREAKISLKNGKCVTSSYDLTPYFCISLIHSYGARITQVAGGYQAGIGRVVGIVLNENTD